MAGEWEMVPLERLVEPDRGISYGIVQPGVQISDGVPIVRVSDVRDGRISTAAPLRVSQAIEAAYARTRLRGGELLLTLVGTVGEVAVVPEELNGWNTARAVAVIPVRKDVGAYWIKIALRSYAVRQIIDSRLNTTVQATLNLGDVAQLPIVLPPKPEREAIAHILGTLDDKIELNRRMSETLEAMARALFKAWFVDFEPVRAKHALSKVEGIEWRWQRGQSLPGLPAHLYDLFPDRLVDSALGEIPDGWEVGTVGEYMINLDSKRIPVSGTERAERNGLYPYHGAAGVMDYVDDYLFDGIHLLVGEDGSVVQNTGMAVTQYVWGKIWVNNHAHVLQGAGAVSTEQLYLYFHFEPVAPYVTGAVQPKLSQGRMNAMPFVFAGDKVCRAFGQAIRPWFAKLRACVQEMKTLAALRDTLLPKLISGEVRVSDAERFVEASQ
jgi:type I restriction enzyme S subunit